MAQFTPAAYPATDVTVFRLAAISRLPSPEGQVSRPKSSFADLVTCLVRDDVAFSLMKCPACLFTRFKSTEGKLKSREIIEIRHQKSVFSRVRALRTFPRRGIKAAFKHSPQSRLQAE